MSLVEPIPKKKRKKKGKTPMVQADELFGKIIRSRGRCENCGGTSVLQCAHGFSRSYKATRWMEEQCFCLCRACHMHFTHRPLEWMQWMKDGMGEEEFDRVWRIALSHDRPHYPTLIARLKDRCAALGIEAGSLSVGIAVAAGVEFLSVLVALDVWDALR